MNAPVLTLSAAEFARRCEAAKVRALAGETIAPDEIPALLGMRPEFFAAVLSLTTAIQTGFPVLVKPDGTCSLLVPADDDQTLN